MPDKNQLIQEKLSSKYFDEVWILNSHTTNRIIYDQITESKMPILVWSCDIKWRNYGDSQSQSKSGYLYHEFDIDEYDSSLLEGLDNEGYANKNQFEWIETLFNKIEEDSIF